MRLLIFNLIFWTSSLSQNTVTGSLESIPSLEKQIAGFTFKNNSTGQIQEFLTDSTTKEISTVLDAGNYTLEAKADSHFIYRNPNVTINGNTNFKVQTYKFEPALTPGYGYPHSLFELWLFSSTSPLNPSRVIYRIPDNDFPLKFSFLNTLEEVENYFRQVFQETTDSIPKMTFVEVANINDAKFKIRTVPPPLPDGGNANAFNYYQRNGTLDSVVVLIRNDINPTKKLAWGEILRGYGGSANGPKEWILSSNGVPSIANSPSKAEWECLRKMYYGDNLKDMSQILDSVATDITPVFNYKNTGPNSFYLGQNYPNPFNPSTIIPFRVETASDIKLSVYNTLGQVVKKLIDQRFGPGFYEIKYEPANLQSGVYFFRMEVDSYGKEFYFQKKGILIK